MKNLFDCHLHVHKGLEAYHLELANANVIYNDVNAFKEDENRYEQYVKSLIFDYKNHYDYVAEQVHSKKVVALKIHSRIQRITSGDYEEINGFLQKLNSNVPIIYDAFYYGSEMSFQPSLEGLIYLAKQYPGRPFVVAHSGGYKVLEYFFHLRDLKNIGFDLSFSLQYLKDSSAESDLMKLLKFTPAEKLFFGSDFPLADPVIQKETLLDLLTKLNFTSTQIEGIFTSNWLNFIANTQQ